MLRSRAGAERARIRVLDRLAAAGAITASPPTVEPLGGALAQVVGAAAPLDGPLLGKSREPSVAARSSSQFDVTGDASPPGAVPPHPPHPRRPAPRPPEQLSSSSTLASAAPPVPDGVRRPRPRPPPSSGHRGVASRRDAVRAVPAAASRVRPLVELLTAVALDPVPAEEVPRRRSLELAP